MALTVLLEARPMRAADAVPVVVRLAGLGSRPYTHAGVNDWWAGITDAPRFSTALAFGQSGWTGGAVPTTGAISFAPSDRARIDSLAGLVWDDAPVTIWTGDDAAADPVWKVALDGVVAGIVTRDGVLTITVADLSKKLARPIAADRFTGKGGIEGGSDAAERLKRRSFGRCWGVEARLLDKAANIYEVGDPARPLASIDAVKDRGRAASAVAVVAWAGSIAATLDALKASAVPQSGAAVAPSIACVKWWTQSPGLLTVDLRGEVGVSYVETVAEIAVRIIDGVGLVPVDAAAAVAARPGAAGLHVDSDSETAAQALDRLLLRASLLWLLEPAGTVRLLPIGFDAAGPIVDAVDASREASYKPVTRIVLGYQRNHRPHNAGEISAVFQASDGSYADGTPIEELKPATRGADVTGANTAAAIFGQGAFATQSRLDLDNGSFFTQPGRFQPYPGNANFFGAWKIAFGDGAGLDGLQPGEANANRTEGRVAASFLGQGVLATLSSLSRTGGLLTGFGGLAGSDLARLGSTIADSFGTVLSNAQVITGQGVSAGFFGQGALATLNFLGADRVGFKSGGGNLVRNSGLDGPTYTITTDLGVQTLPAGYGPYNNAGSADPTQWRVVGGYGRSGGPCIAVSWSKNTSTKGVYVSNAGGINNLDVMKAGRTYCVSVYARGTGAAIGRTMFTAFNYHPMENVAVENPPMTDQYQRYVFRLRWGATVDRELYWSISGADGTATMDLDDFQIEEGDTPTAYAPGLLAGELRAPLLAWDAVRLGQNVTRADGVTVATDALLVTGLGTAAAIAGQSSWATFGTPTSTIQKLGYDGNLPATGVYLPGVAFLNERWPEEAGSNRTENRVASGFLGQSPWATFGTPTSAIQKLGSDGNLPASGVYLPGVAFLNQRWPDEAGSNRTETRVAAAIAGQGALATQGSADWRTQVTNVPYGSVVTNYFPIDQWVAGGSLSDPVMGLSPNVNGGTRENRLASLVGPAGVREPVLHMVSGADGGPQGGFNFTSYLGRARGFDPRDSWRLSIWARQDPAANGSLYLGTSSDISVLRMDGQSDGNPYFWVGVLPTRGKWYVIVGHIHGSSSDGGDSGQSGVYDPETGYRVLAGADFRFAAGASWLGMRAYQYYSGDGSTADFARPKMERISEASPSLASLMSNSALLNVNQRWSQVGNDNGGRPVDYADVTRNNTAAAIVGQGAFASISQIDLTNTDRFTHGGRFASASYGAQWFQASNVAWGFGTGGTVQEWKPGEPNANVTEGRTAAAIAGQGTLATQSAVGYASQITGLPTALQPGNMEGGQILDARHIAYIGYDRVSSLRPAEAGSNRTEGRTAAAIVGQGSLATQSGVSYRTQVADLPRAIAPSAFFASGFMYASEIYHTAGSKNLDTYFPEDVGSNRTQGHTAAGISGQGALATLSNVRLGAPSPDYPGFTSLINQTNGYYVTDAAAITSQGTAGGIAGQGPFATRAGGVSLDDNSLFNMAATARLAPLDNGDTRYFNADRVQYGNANTGYANLDSLKPQEAGGNRTETRTASAIAGQGSLATRNGLGMSEVGDPWAGYIRYDNGANGTSVQSLRPEEAGGNRTESRTASAIVGQGAFATAPQIGSWNVASYYNFSAFRLDYSITRSDGVSIVTEALSITQYGVAAAFAGQGTLATKNQAGAGDLAPSAVQRVAYSVLQQTISCGVGN